MRFIGAPDCGGQLGPYGGQLLSNGWTVNMILKVYEDTGLLAFKILVNESPFRQPGGTHPDLHISLCYKNAIEAANPQLLADLLAEYGMVQTYTLIFDDIWDGPGTMDLKQSANAFYQDQRVLQAKALCPEIWLQTEQGENWKLHISHKSPPPSMPAS